ncbi:MAG: PhoX family phosphatase [Porticoccaceae bacterium]
MNKNILALAIAGVLMAGLTGCDSSDDSTASTAPSTPAPTGSALATPVGADQDEFMVATDFTVPGYSTNLNGSSSTLQTAAVDMAKVQAFGFHKLVATGYEDNGETFGWIKDKNQKGLVFADGSKYICNGTNQGVGSGLDNSSLIQQQDGALRLVAQFECQVGAMYTAGIDQDAVTGALSMKPDTLEFIDQSGEFGGYTHCAGMVTPWNTHLGSEEYEPNARNDSQTAIGKTGDTYYNATFPFWTGKVEADQSNDPATGMNPYFYGWIPEVKADGTGYTKHYSMGRVSHELAYVMPDQKTVYMSDDGTNDGFYKFVADKAGDLSAGTLYAAKFSQVDGTEAGKFNLDWIDLGHADDVTIRAEVAKRPVFEDLFSTATPDANTGACPADFARINTEAGLECLQVKPGMEIAASRLETRRYAAMLGATTELRKTEGITFDAATSTLYVAISEIGKGMLANDPKYDLGGNDDIQLAKNNCGAVYALPVGTDYNATAWNGLIAGTPKTYDATSAFAGNTCDVDGIANPDNINMIPGTRLLMIGEDSGEHVNNVYWAYDLDKKSLKRVLTVPKEAEVTSTYWHPFGNYAYLTVVGQHPLAGVDGVSADQQQTLLGYIGPFIKN